MYVCVYVCLQKDVDVITIRITANSFLQRMVRNIVGVLVQVGAGHMSLVEVKALLEKKDRVYVPVASAPATGLYLMDVHYDPLGTPSSFYATRV